MSDIEVRSLAELEQTGDHCLWPKPQPQPNARMVPHKRHQKGNSDTTKKNMGRRQNPKCLNCSRRVDAVGDLYCRVCVDRCWT